MPPVKIKVLIACISHRHIKILILSAFILIGLNGCASLFVAMGKQNQENYWQYDLIQNTSAFLSQDDLLTVCFTGFNTATREHKPISFDLSVRPNESHDITGKNFKHLVGDETYGEYIRIPSTLIHSDCSNTSRKSTVPVITFNFSYCTSIPDHTDHLNLPIDACPELQQNFLALHLKDKSILHALYQIKRSSPEINSATVIEDDIDMMAFVSVSGVENKPNKLLFFPESRKARVRPGINHEEPIALIFDIATLPLQMLMLGIITWMND